MSTTPLEPVTLLPVTAEQVTELAAEVWSSFLGLALEPLPDAAVRGDVMTGLVGITGTWTGSVVLRCPSAHATTVAEAMFAAEPGSLDPAEVADALGELTNMVGGGVKSLLPEPSALSLPSVVRGTDSSVFVPHALPVLEVGLRCGDTPLQVTLWQV